MADKLVDPMLMCTYLKYNINTLSSLHYFRLSSLQTSLLKSLDKEADSRWVEEVVGQLLHLPRPGGAPHQNLIRRNIKKLTVNVKAVQQNLAERMMAKRTCLSGLICSMIFLICGSKPMSSILSASSSTR